MLQLYHAAMSTCSQKARLVLAEKGVIADEVMINLATGEQKRPEYLALNPGGYVPTLVHDGLAIPESAVIAEYLDEAFPDPPLKPANAAGRARMRWWTRLVEEQLHPANSAISIAIWMRDGLLKQPAEQRERALSTITNPGRRAWRRDLIEKGIDSTHAAAALQTLDHLCGDMECVLAEHPWLAGESYTLADIGFAVYINRLDELQLGSVLFAERPHLTQWLQEVRARQSYSQAVAPYQVEPALETMGRLGEAALPQVKAVLRHLRAHAPAPAA